jgi:hypothetical protein
MFTYRDDPGGHGLLHDARLVLLELEEVVEGPPTSQPDVCQTSISFFRCRPRGRSPAGSSL